MIGIMVVLLYASRACYNLVVLALADIENINSFDYDWYNVSDQVGFLTLQTVPTVVNGFKSAFPLIFDPSRRTCSHRWEMLVTSCLV